MMITTRPPSFSVAFFFFIAIAGCQNTALSDKTGSPQSEVSQPEVGQLENGQPVQQEGEGAGSVPVRNRTPSIEGRVVSPRIDVGQPFEFIPIASDPDGDILTFSVTGLPSWASFDSSNGRIFGVPGSAASGVSATISVSVSDGVATAHLPSFSVEVLAIVDENLGEGISPPLANNAPQVSGLPATIVTTGERYSFTPLASDPEGDTLTFSVTGLPSWMFFDRDTGTIEGRPNEADAGIYTTISIRVSDGTETASLAPFSITVFVPVTDSGETLYVDAGLTAPCDDYTPAQRSCGSGFVRAFPSLRGAADIAQAGDTVLIRAGIYEEGLYPANSGQPDNPLTFAAYSDENVTITGRSLSPAIDISNLRYVVIRGLTISNVKRWLYAVDAHYNIIENNIFRRALDPYSSSKTGVYFERATFNRVIGNTLDESTAHNMSLIDADRNLIENNRFLKAEHGLWTIKCGDFNVLRGNYFHNADQKIGEIYDCDDVGFAGVTAIDDTRRNLVERNEFAYTPSSGNSSPYAGIQYAAQQGIIRFNNFYNTTGPALSMTLYGGEATRNWGNRVYHNVFQATAYTGISLASASADRFDDNHFVNNVLANTLFVANDPRWSWFTGELNGEAVQSKTGRLDSFLFTNNALRGDGEDGYLITHGGIRSGAPSGLILMGWETAHPELFSNNIVAAPQFRNAEAQDFSLTGGGPLIDRGAFLTRTVGTANETTVLAIEDSSFFYDGFSLAEERGDEIQVENSVTKARILSIDYENHLLYLDALLSWGDGQGGGCFIQWPPPRHWFPGV